MSNLTSWREIYSNIERLENERNEMLKMLVELMPCLHHRISGEFGECSISDIQEAVEQGNPLCYKCIELAIEERINAKKNKKTD